MLYRRPLAETQAVALPGTEGAEYPFFSPDGQWVGFAAGKKLKKVALSGGPPIDLCELTVTGVPVGDRQAALPLRTMGFGRFLIPAVNRRIY